MKNLISKILKEEVDTKTISDLIIKYRAKSPTLEDLAKKIESGKPLGGLDKDIAIITLTDRNVLNKMKKNIISYIGDQRNTSIQSDIKQKGIDVFNSFKQEGSYKNLLDDIFTKKQYKIQKPSEEWFEQNLTDLKIITSVFPDLLNRQSVKNEIYNCEERNYFGIVEEIDEKLVWSILNKLDTNYINWGKLISEKINSGQIKMVRELPSAESEVSEYIDFYFTKKNISNFQIDSELLVLLDKYKIEELSFAHLDIIEAFYLYVNDKNKDKLDFILSNIQETSDLGNKVETNFLKFLETKTDDISYIHSFSTPGNLVDMKLGIDMLVRIFGSYYAVQVKTKEDHAKKALIKHLPVDYLVIYPNNPQDPFSFNYLTKKTGSIPGNFNSLFKKKEVQEPPKKPIPPPNYDYLKWAGLDPDA
jgi:hypothetical protein